MDVRTHRRRLPKGRISLAKVASQARPFIDVKTAAAALKLDSKRTAKQLARWHEQGLLRRIHRGVYAVVPPSAVLQEHVVIDPWLVVPLLFRQAYVAGWSAAEHWDITEQLFKTLLICATDPIKQTKLHVAGVEIRARHIAPTLWFGTVASWRDGTRVLVSDIHKTVVDMCLDPALGGGIQHVAQCFSAYLRRDDADAQLLAQYATRTRYAPAVKRLGFICEALGGPDELRDACLRGVTLGLAKLDPVIASPRVSRRWQLRLPNAWEKMLTND